MIQRVKTLVYQPGKVTVLSCNSFYWEITFEGQKSFFGYYGLKKLNFFTQILFS